VATAAKVQYRGLRVNVIALFRPLIEQPAQTIAYSRALRCRRIGQACFLPVASAA